MQPTEYPRIALVDFLYWASLVHRIPGGCWLWQGRTDGGYARVQPIGFGRQVPLHRLFYEFEYGVVSDDMVLDHLCRNRNCVRPGHLEPVTNRENVIRGIGPSAINARKTHCRNGHPLTLENLHMRRDGRRECRVCRRANQEARRARDRAARLNPEATRS